MSKKTKDATAEYGNILKRGVGEMLNYAKSYFIFQMAYSDCLRYWRMAGKDDEEAFKGRKPLEMTKKELKEYVKVLEKEMKQAAQDLQFERAASLRDRLFEYKARL